MLSDGRDGVSAEAGLERVAIMTNPGQGHAGLSLRFSTSRLTTKRLIYVINQNKSIKYFYLKTYLSLL